MNTIKTIVVTATLIAVGFGANIVLNKPIANAPFGEDGFWEPSEADSGGEAVASRPELSIPPFDSDSSLRNNPFASDGSSGGSSIEMPTDHDSTLTALNNNVNDIASAAVNSVASPAASAFAAGGSNSPYPQAASGNQQPLTPAASTWPSSSPMTVEVPPLQSPPQGSFSAAPISTENGIASTQSPGVGINALASFQSPGHTQPTPSTQALPIDFESTWRDAQGMLSTGDLSGALYTLSTLYGHPSLTRTQSERLTPLLDQLAGSVVFSTAHTLQAAYVAGGGETLAAVAERFQVPAEFLSRVNGISSPVLVPGQRLKVVQGPFRGELSRANRELTLFLGPSYAGRFNVEIGRDFPSPATQLVVTEKSGARPFTDSTTGATTAAGSGDNPYGLHWIGLDAGVAGGPNIGLHSVGQGVDASDTRGCISVSQSDASDLLAILSIGSEIRIVP